MNHKKYTTIVLTGGPCGGKSKVLKILKNELTEQGYPVICISETATDMHTAGLKTGEKLPALVFQRSLLNLQLAKEDAYTKAIDDMDIDHVFVLLDRGALDGGTYLSEDEFKIICEEAGVTIPDLLARYDLVIHLTTAAKGADDHYTSGAGTDRHETPEEAAALDDRILKMWAGHPNRRFIPCYECFDEKAAQLLTILKEICD